MQRDASSGGSTPEKAAAVNMQHFSLESLYFSDRRCLLPMRQEFVGTSSQYLPRSLKPVRVVDAATSIIFHNRSIP